MKDEGCDRLEFDQTCVFLAVTVITQTFRM